jgi:predicted flap endonuclease-1-like 5' DNA nuclease
MEVGLFLFGLLLGILLGWRWLGDRPAIASPAPELETLRERAAAAEARVREVEAARDATDARIAAIERKGDMVAERARSLEEELARLQATLAAAQARQAEVEAALRRAREELNPKRNGAAVPALAPEGVPTDPTGDDLTRIKGIGRKMQERLNALGIRTLSQLAALTPEEIARVDAAIEFPGRVARERWV